MKSKQWETEGDYAEGVFFGLPVFIRRTDHLLFLTGYCGVPEGHIYFNKHYDDIHDIECHGGLTFSSGGTHANFGYFWWLGFDAAHCGDFVPAIPYHFEGDCYRAMPYMQQECINLAKQLSNGKVYLPNQDFQTKKKIISLELL